MFFNTLPVSSLLSLAWAATAQAQTTATDGIKLYAYGPGISGLPVWAGSNDNAIIAAAVNASDLTSISWSISEDGSEPWNVTTNSTSSPISSGASFYIVTTTDAFAPAGFTDDDADLPSGAVNVGIVLYGSDVMYVSDQKLKAQFWASPIGSTGKYKLVWNSNGEQHDGAVPVGLKPKAPSSSKA